MNRGFSLVELSIVLVILGLLTGGILAGQNLIRAAELRSVATQFQTLQAATYTFRDKYFAIPGDMKNAGSFWGYPGNNVSNCPGTAGTGTQTCDGDGDGQIDGASASSNYGERFMFWQHLANAGLIEGTYTGRAGSGGISAHDTTNAPRSKLSNGLWSAVYRVMAVNHFARPYGNTLYMGATNTNHAPFKSILSPEELWNIDKKLDDGMPAYGKVTPLEFINCTTATLATDLDATYKLTDQSALCFANFVGFY